jgi:sirohydrochlorin cobaltochelatase
VSKSIVHALESWLDAGCERIGQIVIQRADSGFRLAHHADGETDARLDKFARPGDARDIARYDDAGNYRPLKSAPNLRRGWELTLASTEDLRLALDFFYPAMFGSWLAFQKNEIAPVNLRETLDRQTGMYRVAGKITNAQADELVGRVCRPDGGCLKTILWKIDRDSPVTTLPEEKFDPSANLPRAIPLLCAEACNLLVAAARETVKKSQ